ncbi:DUF551 domain-containing protein [Citrobacter freundii]|uniref:DUF551 domain-containing protein n=1 Tax=Citrobacter freundii TaxID=546 RepID=UPI0039B6B1C3
MTTNHPAHGPVSLDRLHQIREILSKAAAQSDGGNLGYAMADAVKVIDGAIAAFGAEPAPVDIEMLATVLRNAPLAPSDRQGRPRALVVPEECKEAPAYVKALTKEGAYIYGFNACRAAMLQAEPVSNSDELPLDYLQGHKDGLEWAAQLAKANHPETGDWLYDDPIELSKAIRKGPDMPLSDGNSPVIQDGWIKCSERMPEDEQEVLTRNRMGHCFVSFFDEHSGLFFDRVDVAAACCIEHILVTHWMPLPAAPQQEE